MDVLEFIGIIATAALVIFSYLRNRVLGADGAGGLLALSDDSGAVKPGARRRAYRIKKRRARPAMERNKAQPVQAAANTAPAYAKIRNAARMRRKFRRQDEARYHVKDKAARFRPDAESA